MRSKTTSNWVGRDPTVTAATYGALPGALASSSYVPSSTPTKEKFPSSSAAVAVLPKRTVAPARPLPASSTMRPCTSPTLGPPQAATSTASTIDKAESSVFRDLIGCASCTISVFPSPTSFLPGPPQTGETAPLRQSTQTRMSVQSAVVGMGSFSLPDRLA